MDLQKIIYQIDELKQENLRLKNRERELLKVIEEKNDKIESLTLRLLDRDTKMNELEQSYKNLKGLLYDEN